MFPLKWEFLAIRNSLYSELEQHIRESEAVKTVSELQIELNDCKMAKVMIFKSITSYLSANIFTYAKESYMLELEALRNLRIVKNL